MKRDEEVKGRYTELLKGAEPVSFEIAEDIISYATERYQMKLNDIIHVTLADHIDGLLKRIREELNLTNQLTMEIKRIYSNEFDVGQYGIEKIFEKIGIQPIQDEAAFIVLQFVNNQSDMQAEGQEVKVTLRFVSDILNLVQQYFGITIEENGLGAVDTPDENGYVEDDYQGQMWLSFHFFLCILKENRGIHLKKKVVCMNKVIGIGKQSFEDIILSDCFYVDKTNLIKEWWESEDYITLITRPRRFGKTLNMDMLKCFFSNRYQNRQDLFENLKIWEQEKYHALQGTYPVIYLSFADVKQTNYKDAVLKIKKIITEVYQQYIEISKWEGLTDVQSKQFRMIDSNMDDVSAQCAIKDLSNYLYHYYGKKVIILLDEFDTPMQEAYMHGYWDEFTAFIRSLFNATFKTNPYLNRAMMTGITRVSKESIFSDLNNLKVVTTTSEEYATCFGFTEEEVFTALENFQLSEQKSTVKRWYDGFTFGSQKDIYNPWSITNYLKEKKFSAYWASTSSNGLVNRLIQTSQPSIKEMMEELLNEREIIVNFDEQIVFDQLEKKENAIWSLMVASGYLKVDMIEYRGVLQVPWYHLKITNLETLGMFYEMFQEWFQTTNSNYNAFIRALLSGNIKEMNAYMNEVALATFSNFDIGNHPSGRTQPERFYHGFVLGLLVELRDRYEVKSNRESGYGRYDVMLIPCQKENTAIVLEFKVHDSDEEVKLQDTVQSALKQIEEKNYDAELLDRGIKKSNIYHYGFAFEGKQVLIGD